MLLPARAQLLADYRQASARAPQGRGLPVLVGALCLPAPAAVTSTRVIASCLAEAFPPGPTSTQAPTRSGSPVESARNRVS